MIASSAPFSSAGFMVILSAGSKYLPVRQAGSPHPGIARRFPEEVLELYPAAILRTLRRPRRPHRTFCAFVNGFLRTVLAASGRWLAGAPARERRAERRSSRGATRRTRRM